MSLYRPIEFRDGGTPTAGLVPTVDACYRVSDKVAVAPLPTVDEIGDGAYRIIHDADVPWVALVDSNDAGMSDQDRYKWVLLTANDFGMDTLIVRVPGEVAQKAHLVDGTGDIVPPTDTGLWDVLDATVGSRALEAGGALADVKTKTDNLPADTSAEFDEIDAALVVIDDFVDGLETTSQTIKKYLRNFIKVNKTSGIYTLYDDASGVELCPSPTCAADFFDTKGVGWTHDAGNTQYDCDGTQVADSDLSEAGLLVSGVTYRVQFVISNYSAGNICAVCGTQEGTDRAANGTWVNYILANGTGFKMRADAAFVGSIDSISIQSAAVLETGTIADDGTLKTRTPD